MTQREGHGVREGGEGQREEGRERKTDRQHLEHLRDVQKLASLGVLVRALAHDFNNHLTVILGNCSLAQADLDRSSPLQKRLDRVRQAAQHSAGLTEQLLSYSDSSDSFDSAGARAGSAKPIHLPHLLESMRELLVAAAGRRCELSIEGPPQLPLIDVVESQLQQMIVNLVMNASEALERKPGHAWIRVGVERASRDSLADAIGADDLPDADYVYLEVEDDGSGIEEEDRSQLFEPFFTSKTPGRGLGLCAVLGIVQSHRGVIKVASVPGSGTKVRVLFPQSGSGD